MADNDPGPQRRHSLSAESRPGQSALGAQRLGAGLRGTEAAAPDCGPAPEPTWARTGSPARRGLRVALVSDYYYPDLGGMPEHVHHLATELSRRGHVVTVITTAFPPLPVPSPPASPASAASAGAATRRDRPSAPAVPSGARAPGAPAGANVPCVPGGARVSVPPYGEGAPLVPGVSASAAPSGASAPTPAFEVVRLGQASGAIIANGSVSRAAVGLGLGAAMRRLFQRRGFDIIHVHAPIFPTLSLLAIRCAPPGARLIGTLHTHFDDSQLLRLFRRPLQRYLDALDGVIAVSDSALACMRRLGFCCEAEIIPNGVDLAYWQAGQSLPAWQDGAVHLIAQARLEPRNHVSTIIEALRLLQRAPEPERRLRLLVLGEGPQRAALRAQSAGLPVHFAGAVLAERADFVATSDIYCFTAAIASHPMALLEGMAAGRPVLAHDIDGVRQLITDGVEGLVLPLADPRAYAAALRRLAADPALRLRLGAAARARVAAFSWPRVTDRIEAYYFSLLGPG